MEKEKVEEKDSKKSKKKIVVISLVVILLLIAIIISVFIVKRQTEYNKIQIELKESQVELKYGESLDVNQFLSKYEGGEIEIQNNIDFEKVGEYKVIYKVKSENGLEKTKEMTVNIKDEIKPVITLDKDSIEVKIDEEIDILSGVKAEDNYDKDITDKIVVTGEVDTKTEGTYEVKYDVKDSNNNVAETKIRKYTVKKKVTLQIGKTYKWEDSTGGATITFKQNNQVEASAWASLGGGSEYKGTYKLKDNKVTVTITQMYDFGEWSNISPDAEIYTIIDNNQIQREYHSRVLVYKIK